MNSVIINQFWTDQKHFQSVYQKIKSRDVHLTTQQQWGEQKLNIRQNQSWTKIQLIWLGFNN